MNLRISSANQDSCAARCLQLHARANATFRPANFDVSDLRRRARGNIRWRARLHVLFIARRNRQRRRSGRKIRPRTLSGAARALVCMKSIVTRMEVSASLAVERRWASRIAPPTRRSSAKSHLKIIKTRSSLREAPTRANALCAKRVQRQRCDTKTSLPSTSSECASRQANIFTRWN